MKKLGSILISFTMVASFAVSALAQPASKFAAHVPNPGDDMYLLHSGISHVDDNNTDANGEANAALDDSAPILQTIIRTPNKKDLLIGVSLQSQLYTDTTVKGKNGSTETAEAMGGIEVEVIIDNGEIKAYPEKVIFEKRFQKLTATLGGVIESCAVPTDEYGHVTGDIVISRDCVVSDEMIGLTLDTTSANHFNFVAPDLTPGDHTVEVQVTALSSAAVANGTYCPDLRNEDGSCPVDEVLTSGNEATGYAIVQLGSLTVEEVRAVNTHPDDPEGVFGGISLLELDQ